MATIKAFSDLEQSKKLAEILPLESADMYYNFDVDFTTGEFYFPADGSSIMVRRNNKPLNLDLVIPCWSLASLLDVLPDNYVDVNDTIYHPNLMKTKDGRYMVIYNVSQYTSLYNDPIDACVAMIERLHKLNLL